MNAQPPRNSNDSISAMDDHFVYRVSKFEDINSTATPVKVYMKTPSLVREKLFTYSHDNLKWVSVYPYG